MDDKRRPEEDRVAIPLDPEEALRALLKVDPQSEPAQGESTLRSKPPEEQRDS